MHLLIFKCIHFSFSESDYRLLEFKVRSFRTLKKARITVTCAEPSGEEGTLTI